MAKIVARFAMFSLVCTCMSGLAYAQGEDAPFEEGGPLIIGDLIFIDVYRHPDLSLTTQVDPNGNIQMPYVGLINVAGLPENEAAARISAALSRILRNPRVTVSRSALLRNGGRTSDMRTEMIALKNSSAEALSTALQGMTSKGGHVSYDPSTNTLIITDSPSAIQNMMSVVERLDQMQSQLTQVRLKARIAEVQAGAMKELGVRWWAQGEHVGGGYYPLPTQDSKLRGIKGIDTGGNQNEVVNSNTTGNVVEREFVNAPPFDRRLNVPVQIPTVGQLFLGFLDSQVDIGAMLDALVLDNKAELLADPMILTVNHKKAEIRMTDEFPYTEFGTEVSGRANFSVKFMDLGIKMWVTPHVNEDVNGSYVKLELEPEVSYASGSSNGVPIRSVRKYSGEANVRDSQTLVIGGIYRNDMQNVEQRVPGLGRIPVLGGLFKHKEKAKSRTELMVFVTPTIYASPEDITWDKMIDLTSNKTEEPKETVAPTVAEAPLAEE